MKITLKGFFTFLCALIFLTALNISLVLNDSNTLLAALVLIVLINRAFIIPILFTIPTIEGVYSLETASNAESIAVAFIFMIVIYDLLRKNNQKAIPVSLIILYLCFIGMTFLGLIVYRKHPEVGLHAFETMHVPKNYVTFKVFIKIFKIIFFLVFLKFLINAGKEYILKSLELFKILAPYITISIVIYSSIFGYVSNQFGGVLHLGESSHGDFTANLCSMGGFIYLSIFDRKSNLFSRIIGLAALILLLYLIMQMGSRNGLLSFGFVSVFSAWLIMIKRSTLFQVGLVSAALIGAVAALYIFQDSPTMQRALYMTEVESGGERMSYWSAGFEAIKEAPVLGLGGDESASMYAVAKYSPEVTDHVMHNTFLEVAVEYGLTGLLFYLIFVFTILKWGYRDTQYALQTNQLILAMPAIGYTVSIIAGLFISRIWETTLWYYLELIFAIGILWIYPQRQIIYRKQIIPFVPKELWNEVNMRR